LCTRRVGDRCRAGGPGAVGVVLPAAGLTPGRRRLTHPGTAPLLLHGHHTPLHGHHTPLHGHHTPLHGHHTPLHGGTFVTLRCSLRASVSQKCLRSHRRERHGGGSGTAAQRRGGTAARRRGVAVRRT